MKKILLLTACMAALMNLSKAQSCCSKPAQEQEGMSLLASNKDFIEAHLNPEPFTYTAETGKMISFKTTDGKDGSAFAVIGDSTSNKVLLVFHEWWGLNDYIKQEAEKLHKELKVNVYAIDLYDGQVASDRETAGKLAGSLNAVRASTIISGLLTHLGKGKQIATLGWCMGGGWSLQATLLAKTDAKACVMYYGFPEQDTVKLKENLKTDILFIQGTQDKFITPELVASFEKNVGKTGHSITVHAYDADHAFANPSNPQYKKEYAEEAHKLAVAFIKKGLKIK